MYEHTTKDKIKVAPVKNRLDLGPWITHGSTFETRPLTRTDNINVCNIKSLHLAKVLATNDYEMLL